MVGEIVEVGDEAAGLFVLKSGLLIGDCVVRRLTVILTSGAFCTGGGPVNIIVAEEIEVAKIMCRS